MNGGAPLGRTRSAPILAHSAALASYPGIEVLNSSSVPRVKFIVEYKNLILAGINVSESSACPVSGRLVGRTVPTRYSFSASAIVLPPRFGENEVIGSNHLCRASVKRGR